MEKNVFCAQRRRKKGFLQKKSSKIITKTFSLLFYESDVIDVKDYLQMLAKLLL
jgi:hypothetical protein